MKEPYQVVDLFAGPGGLAEGFSSVFDGRDPSFKIAMSVEMESAAHRTLTLRSFTRQFPWRELPDAYYSFIADEISLEQLREEFPKEWNSASEEALRLELGTTEAAQQIIPRIDQIRERSGGRTILIGGPPCQAYSLVGRSRNAGIQGYVPEDDGRHFLYREYIRILDRLRPSAFVMENVKGILSSSVAGGQIFQHILEDLGNVGREDGGYRLVALTPNGKNAGRLSAEISARDFIVRAEKHGVPQARHRVFVIGLRADIATKLEATDASPILSNRETVSVRDILHGMPRLRSGLSKKDDECEWRDVVQVAATELINLTKSRNSKQAFKSISKSLRAVKKSVTTSNACLSRSNRAYALNEFSKNLPVALGDFLTDPKLKTLAHHESRGHMKSDLARYLFCSAFAEIHHRPAKATDFPEELAPDHQSWATGKFADRFRVQTWDGPSTTITSHISKDGHYYIHPDPVQCRSLTVREAARLQTFPDNYIFLGNRTQQYVQVGNAVPPYLAKQIAEAMAKLLP